MSILQEEFEYEFKDKTLVIKKCPDNILSYSLISSILNHKSFETVIVLLKSSLISSIVS